VDIRALAKRFKVRASIETLEKMSRALEVSFYQLFYEGNDLPEPPKADPQSSIAWEGCKGRAANGEILPTTEPPR
jgi:hypothetical protein